MDPQPRCEWRTRGFPRAISSSGAGAVSRGCRCAPRVSSAESPSGAQTRLMKDAGCQRIHAHAGTPAHPRDYSRAYIARAARRAGARAVCGGTPPPMHRIIPPTCLPRLADTARPPRGRAGCLPSPQSARSSALRSSGGADRVVALRSSGGAGEWATGRSSGGAPIDWRWEWATGRASRWIL